MLISFLPALGQQRDCVDPKVAPGKNFMALSSTAGLATVMECARPACFPAGRLPRAAERAFCSLGGLLVDICRCHGGRTNLFEPLSIQLCQPAGFRGLLAGFWREAPRVFRLLLLPVPGRPFAGGFRTGQDFWLVGDFSCGVGLD